MFASALHDKLAQNDPIEADSRTPTLSTTMMSMMEMGFSEAASRMICDREGEDLFKCLDKMYMVENEANAVQQLMEIGFEYMDAKKRLEGHWDVSLALEMQFEEGEKGFLVGLIERVRNHLEHLATYCCVCYKKHYCNRYSSFSFQFFVNFLFPLSRYFVDFSDFSSFFLILSTEKTTVICSNSLCLFQYSELKLGSKDSPLFLCPFKECNAKMANAKVQNGYREKMSFADFMSMYDNPNYSFLNYLPHQDMLKFITEGILKLKTEVEGLKPSGMRVKTVTNVLKPENAVKFSVNVCQDFLDMIEIWLNIEVRWEELKARRPELDVKPQICYVIIFPFRSI